MSRARALAVLGSVLMFVVGPPLAARAYTYTGAIKGQLVYQSTLNPAPATITISPCPAGTAPGCSTSNSPADGSFEFLNLPDGSYTVTYSMTDPAAVAPAPDPATVSGGAVVQLKLHAILFNNTVQMDGYVTDNHGGNVVSQFITLHDVSGATPDVTGSSDPVSGHYVLHPLSGTSYTISMNNYDPSELHAPAVYDLETSPVQPLVLTSNRTVNLDLPEVRLRVCVVDYSGAPIPNTLVRTDQSETLGLTLAGLPTSGSDWYTNAGYPYTGADGCAVLWLFPNPVQHIVTVYPPASTGLATSSFGVPVSLLSDGQTVTLPPLTAATTLTGVVSAGGGAPVAGQLVSVRSALSSSAPWIAATGPTAGDGSYSVPGLILDGSYYVRVTNGSMMAPYAGPDTYSIQTASPIKLTGAAVNLALPVVRVPVSVLGNVQPDGSGIPLQGYHVNASNTGLAGLTLAGVAATGSDSVLAGNWAQTDAAGHTSLWLFGAASGYTFTAAAPAGGRVCGAPAGVSGGTGSPVVFALTCDVSLSGTVLDAAGAPIGGQTVTAVAPGGAAFVATSAAGSGAYSFPALPPATYSITLSGSGGSGGAVPPTYSAVVGSQTLVADVSGLVLRAPFVPLTVQVTLPSGAADPGASLSPGPSASGGTVSFAYPASVGVGADGSFTFWVTPGSYSVVAQDGVLHARGTAVVAGATTLRLQVLPDDGLPPVVKAVLSATPNGAGWNDAPVQVSWVVTDDTATTYNCPTATYGNTTGTTVRCDAWDSAGNHGWQVVTIKVDDTKPVITWSGATSYTVDQTVQLSCSASDPISGVVDPITGVVAADVACGSRSGDAWAFLVGLHSASGSATNGAGTSNTGTVTFTVSVTQGSLCNLVERWESQAGIAHALCVKLGVRGNGNDHLQLNAFVAQVRAQSGKTIDADKALELIQLAEALGG